MITWESPPPILSISKGSSVSSIPRHAEAAPAGIMKWVSSFMNKMPCPECNGARLKKESLWFKIGGMNIAELADIDLISLYDWFDKINDHP